MEFLTWVEGLAISTFIRESTSLMASPGFLFIHILGMSIVAGCAAMIDLSFLGVWPESPRKPLERLYPIIWFGFVINLITGTGLVMADASTRGRNPDLYIKLVFVAIGVWTLLKMRTRVFADPDLDTRPVTPLAKRLAWVSLFCWFAAIIAGRLIAYVGPVPGLG
jgi:hypothetical protein